VEDGVVILTAAVRMAVKNRIIVAALRDQLDFDIRTLSGIVRTEFLRLARENEETADRLGSTPAEAPPNRAGKDNENKALRREEHLRRPVVHRRLASALRDASHDEVAIESLVRRARDDASDEINREVSLQLLARQFAAEPDYAEQRIVRLRRLIDVDLPALLSQSQSTPEKRRPFGIGRW
jgi:tryptophan 2,3-dioxygenase